LLTRCASGIRMMAARSFTLYLLHMPLMMLLAALCIATDHWFPPWMIGVGTLSLPLLIAPAIENRRHAIRAWLQRLACRTAAVPALAVVVRGAHR
jgi:peptidoglycan/LPS O-acetylase OafA/YrhL